MASQVEVDPQETREWLEALDAVVEADGPQRAQFLLERVVGHAQLTGAAPAPAGTTPYLNTIPPQDEPPHPVDPRRQRAKQFRELGADEARGRIGAAAGRRRHDNPHRFRGITLSADERR